ncbi:unnamed protein product [Penicillium camemberti]|uniref:Str. FM013 n=1 Tax=Penicillium camemberti (strain FM 013) TaxID=1429867 RepID=A0A0G4PGQ7_PENC3|nr:unnamed protein product [Penicillium camemberti]
MCGSVLAPASTVHLKLRLAFIAFSPDCPDLPRPPDWRGPKETTPALFPPRVQQHSSIKKEVLSEHILTRSLPKDG